MNKENIALWNKGSRIFIPGGEETVLDVVLYKDAEENLYATMTNGGDIIFEDAPIDPSLSTEDAKTSFRMLFDAFSNEIQKKGCMVEESKEYPQFTFSVMRAEPYYGKTKIFYEGASIDDAIASFMEDLESCYGDNGGAEPLNILNVTYSLPCTMPGFTNVGSCDLIQERFDTPLFLSNDYKSLDVKNFEEIANDAVGELRVAFGLDDFGQPKRTQRVVDGVCWNVENNDLGEPCSAYAVDSFDERPVTAGALPFYKEPIYFAEIVAQEPFSKKGYANIDEAIVAATEQAKQRPDVLKQLVVEHHGKQENSLSSMNNNAKDAVEDNKSKDVASNVKHIEQTGEDR